MGTEVGWGVGVGYRGGWGVGVGYRGGLGGGERLTLTSFQDTN